MLFDLQSGKRRRVVQVVFGALAFIFLISFVGFGIGSPGTGGIFDAIGLGGDSASTGNPQFDQQIDDAEARVADEPQGREGARQPGRDPLPGRAGSARAGPRHRPAGRDRGRSQQLRGGARRLGGLPQARPQAARPRRGLVRLPGLCPARRRRGRRGGAADRRRGQPERRDVRQPGLLPLRRRQVRGGRRGGREGRVARRAPRRRRRSRSSSTRSPTRRTSFSSRPRSRPQPSRPSSRQAAAELPHPAGRRSRTRSEALAGPAVSARRPRRHREAPLPSRARAVSSTGRAGAS